MSSKKLSQTWVLYIYLFVPLCSSVISTVHLYDFVSLANNMMMSLALAFTFELGSIVSFVTLGPNMLNKIKKGYIWTIFIILFMLQAIGNVYAGFDYVRQQLAANSKWLDSFMEMSLGMLDLTTAKLTIAVLIGLPIPVISLILLKSAVDQIYSGDEAPEVKEVVPVIPIPVKEEVVIHPLIAQEEAVPPLPTIEQVEVAPVNAQVVPSPEIHPMEQLQIEQTTPKPEIYNKKGGKKAIINKDIFSRFRLLKK